MPLNMKAALFVFLSFSIAASANAEDVRSIILARETASWQAWVGTRVDVPAAQKLLAPDYIDIDSMGAMWTADQMFAQMSGCGISSFRLEKPQVRLLSSTSAAIVYRVFVDASCGGKQISADLLATSVWVKHGDEWLTELHTETTAAAAK